MLSDQQQMGTTGLEVVQGLKEYHSGQLSPGDSRRPLDQLLTWKPDLTAEDHLIDQYLS